METIHQTRNKKNSIKANNILKSIRVSPELNTKIRKHLKESKMTEGELYRKAVEKYLQEYLQKSA